MSAWNSCCRFETIEARRVAHDRRLVVLVPHFLLHVELPFVSCQLSSSNLCNVCSLVLQSSRFSASISSIVVSSCRFARSVRRSRSVSSVSSSSSIQFGAVRSSPSSAVSHPQPGTTSGHAGCGEAQSGWTCQTSSSRGRWWATWRLCQENKLKRRKRVV